MMAALLAWAAGTPALAVAVVVVILRNAGFSFVQEMQAERAVEALAAFLPATARALRDGGAVEVPARDLVPGDVVLGDGKHRTAIDAGRRVFDNVRKFVLYIFAHAVPEVVQFLTFALSGGAVPLPRRCCRFSPSISVPRRCPPSHWAASPRPG